jgi:hypothetical protein
MNYHCIIILQNYSINVTNINHKIHVAQQANLLHIEIKFLYLKNIRLF